MCEWRVRLTSKHFVPNVRQGLGGLVPWVGGGFPWDMSAPYSAVHTLMHALMTGRWQLHRKHFCFLFSTCETPNPSQLFTSLTLQKTSFSSISLAAEINFEAVLLSTQTQSTQCLDWNISGKNFLLRWLTKWGENATFLSWCLAFGEPFFPPWCWGANLELPEDAVFGIWAACAGQAINNLPEWELSRACTGVCAIHYCSRWQHCSSGYCGHYWALQWGQEDWGLGRWQSGHVHSFHTFHMHHPPSFLPSMEGRPRSDKLHSTQGLLCILIHSPSKVWNVMFKRPSVIL